MIKKLSHLFVALVMLVPFLPTNLSAQSALENITTIKQGVKSKRISSYDRSGGNNDRFENIAPGETRTIAEIEGAGTINHIWITISPEAPELNRSDIILRMYWDGNDYPSVESPIGPFFGQGWDETYPWASLPLAASPVKGNALVSYFRMPFADGALIEIENQADVKIGAFYYYIDYIEQEKPAAYLAYFHAWYNQQITEAAPEGENEWGLLSKEVGKNPVGERNYKIMETSGKGHYVGVNYFVNSPTPVWYGEGDDMFFIDGAEKPTLHGTGTEDYFNSSWCPNEKYAHAYFGYARTPDDIGWLGRTHCYRFHIDDPVHFDQSLLFTIEHGHNNYLTLEMASVAYWYLDKPSKLFPIPGKEERKLKPVVNFLDMHRWRHEWRKNMSEEGNPWGNERIKEQ
ncbi:MAG: DUF2961 domain-containing protein [Bacteroidales bacterium]|nr:DUF2961 domain-containing protein [Bacteroidales bacterium]